jgi:anti-anti-sigma factor
MTRSAAAGRLAARIQLHAGPEGVPIILLRLEGELDAATAPRLRRLAELLLAETGAAVTVDLAELEFVDSTGLGVLLGIDRRFKEAARTISFRRPRRSLVRVLELTGLSRQLALAPT